MKVYTRDYRADPELRSCSIAARGLWWEISLLTHEADPVGYLIVGNERLGLKDAQKIARHVGSDPAEVAELLGELIAHGALNLDEAGTIVSRYQIRVAAAAEAARTNGRKGGNPMLLPGLEASSRAPIAEREIEANQTADQDISGVNPPVNGEVILAGATLETRELETRELDLRPERDARERAETPNSFKAESPGIAFAEWFVAAAVSSGAIAMPLDSRAMALRQCEPASRLIATHGREECEVRAQRLFAAHLAPPGPDRIVRPPNLDALEAWWGSKQLRGEPMRVFGAPRSTLRSKAPAYTPPTRPKQWYEIVGGERVLRTAS